MTALLSFWYEWGVFVGVFLAAAVAIYIIFDSQQAVAPGRATWPRILSLIGVVLTLPSLYYRLTKIGEDTDLTALFEVESNFSLFLYLALGGVLLALGALIYYFMSVRRVPEPVYVTPLYTPVVDSRPPTPVEPMPAPVMRPPVSAEAPAGMAARPRAKTEVLDRRQGPIAFFIDMETGRQFPLADGTAIGSAADNDVILDETSVSGKHAKVKIEDGAFALFDLASTNGTTVNGASVSRHVLADNDELRLGRKTLVFKAINYPSQPKRRNTEGIDTTGAWVQSLRMDVAVPEEVALDVAFKLAVAAMHIQSPKLAVRGLSNVQSEDFEVDVSPKGLSVKLQVSLQAEDCEIIGPSVQTFNLYLKGNLPSKKLIFSLIPRRVGEIPIIVRIKQLDSYVGSTLLMINTRERLAGEVKTIVYSFPISPPSDNLSSSLSQFIVTYFSEGEVRDLSFKMGIDFDNLSGNQKSGKVNALIEHCRHRGRLEELIEHVKQARPNWYELL